MSTRWLSSLQLQVAALLREGAPVLLVIAALRRETSFSVAAPEEVITRRAEAAGVVTDATSVKLLHSGGGIIAAVFSGTELTATLAGAPPAHDIYLARIEKFGSFWWTGPLVNVSQTASCDERSLQLNTERTEASYLTAYSTHSTLHRLSLPDDEASEPLEASLRRAWSSLHRYGMIHALRRETFSLSTPVHELRYDSELALRTDNGWRPLSDVATLAADTRGTVTSAVLPWLADELRATSWVGDFRLQRAKVWGAAITQFWRTQAPRTLLHEPLPRESEPQSHRNSIANRDIVGASPVFPPERGKNATAYQDFVKGSELIHSTWQDARNTVQVVAWSAAQLQLHMVAGSIEPRSDTGVWGTGEIPKASLPTLVAAFNGGFQSIHGSYGMAVNHELIAAPRPFAATVATLDDGSVAFGTWPASLARLPTSVHSFRQNLLPLFDQGRINPSDLQSWGGSPTGWPDKATLLRSGLCVMQPPFQETIAYFWGTATFQQLGSAMRDLGCNFGMALDVNEGLVAFELYAPAGHVRTSALGATEERRIKLNTIDSKYLRKSGRDFFFLSRRTPGGHEVRTHIGIPTD